MATHQSVKSFCEKHKAYTQSSLRFTIFQHGPALEKAGAIFRIGRKVVIVEEPFLEFQAGNNPETSPKRCKLPEAA